MSKQSKKCGLPQESHQWIGNTCTDCGIAWSVWASNTIKELQRQIDALTDPDEQPEGPPSIRSPQEIQVIDELYRRKEQYKPTNAFVTAFKPMQMSHWNGQHPPEKNTTYTPVNPGDTLRIVMVSRFGDCGLTTDLTATHGYGLRVDFENPAIGDIRWTQEPTPGYGVPDQKA